MKKALIILLAVCMLASLAACGSGNKVVGTWSGSGDAKDALAEEMGELGPYLKSAPYDLTITFNSDGTYSYTIDLSPAKDALKSAMRDYFEDYIADAGLTVADFEAYAGQSLDELIDEALAEEDLSQLAQSGTGKYVVEGSKVIMDKDTSGEIDATLNGDSLVVDFEVLDSSVTLRKK